MLVHNTILKDLRQMVNFLQKFEARTDKRYSPQIAPIVNQIGIIDRYVQKELEYIDKLHRYISQGFNVAKYENRAYSRVDELEKAMVQLDKAIVDITPIWSEFKSNAEKIPVNERTQLDQLFRNPDTFKQAIQSWAMIKGRLQKQK